jgi:cutinase
MVFALQLVKFVGLLLAAVSSQVVTAQSSCTDVHVVFARGSTEMPGLGVCGKPLVSGIKSNLNGMTVSSYAVNYLADAAQTSAGPGATDMTNHVVQIAAQCPNTVFVIGGYSQGGSVTDIAIGIKTMLGTGKTIPTDLAPRIKAVVVFGNPLKLFGKTITSASPLYGSKAIEYCNFGDPVCAAGANMMAHLMYPTDGSVTKAAQRAAALVKSGATSAATSASTGSTTAQGSSGSASTTSNGFGFSNLLRGNN